MHIVIEPSPMWGRELFSAFGAKEGWGYTIGSAIPLIF